jgi:hypothetical protein
VIIIRKPTKNSKGNTIGVKDGNINFLQNSYSDFKQSYQVQLEHAKGQLKYGIRYGENYRLPLDEKRSYFI